jgi:hypothetical protein
MFLVIATRLPDHEKWLDALEARANDYCCTSVDVAGRDALRPHLEHPENRNGFASAAEKRQQCAVNQNTDSDRRSN